MAGWSDMGAGNRAGVVVAGGLVVAVLATGLWVAGRPVPPADPAPAAAVPAAVPATATPAAPPPAARMQEPPAFDLVRIESDGGALVAGKAAPGATVSLRLDGAEIATTEADARGQFVAMLTLPPDAAPRLMTLAEIAPDRAETPGRASVAVAPIAAPDPAAPQAGEGLAEEGQAGAAPGGAPPAPEALLITDQGVRLLQPAGGGAPLPEGQVSVDTIAYTRTGSVLIGGRGGRGDLIRLYLDNALVAETRADDGTWAVELRGIAPGLYTMRADQLAAGGAVTARFETPFRRETPEALAAALKPRGQGVPVDPVAPQPRAGGAPAEPAGDAPADTSAGAAPLAPAARAGGGGADAIPSPAALAGEGAPEGGRPVSVTVQPGYTLWGIARSQFGDGTMYVQVYQANRDRIRDPDLIYPGQIFALPAEN